MLNFLFGVLCASGAVFGSLLTWMGVTDHSYEAVIAGGIFLFGSLLTFGLAQIHRLIRRREDEMRARQARRLAIPGRPFKRPGAAVSREEPEAFPDFGRTEPVIPHPVLERVASRFARPGR